MIGNLATTVGSKSCFCARPVLGGGTVFSSSAGSYVPRLCKSHVSQRSLLRSAKRLRYAAPPNSEAVSVAPCSVRLRRERWFAEIIMLNGWRC